MTVLRTIQDVRKALQNKPGVGLVPTMGALHEGHRALLGQCAKECDTSIVSIFVNPTQFGPNEDFAKYPRPLEADLEAAESEGVQYAFVPEVDEIYHGNVTTVHVAGVTELWEGALRPGHFDGVATVVLKLFNIVRPERAYFGLKDLQQCSVVSRMVQDLNLTVDLRFVETVRAQSGLALSSRNTYLSVELRTKASQLYAELTKCADQIVNPTADVNSLVEACAEQLESLGFHVDYVALVDPHSMRPLSAGTADSRIIAAVRLGGVRLIDNVPAKNG